MADVDQQAPEQSAFPYGVAADIAVDDATADDRGADTINRALLHGARFHEREGVLWEWVDLRRGGRGWEKAPDWRADRNSLRVGLVLRQRLRVDRGDTVAMWLPFGADWLAIERGVWSLGAVSAPVLPEWPVGRVRAALEELQPAVLFTPSLERFESLRMVGGIPASVRASIHCEAADEMTDGEAGGYGGGDEADGGGYAADTDALSLSRFMDYGGVLDTPERASMWRTGARSIAASDPASREASGSGIRTLSQGDWLAAIRRFLDSTPPVPNRVFVLTGSDPHVVQRLLAYASWADGFTSLAIAATPEAQAQSGELRADLIACSADRVDAIRDFQTEPHASRSTPARFVLLESTDEIFDSDGPGHLHIQLRRNHG